MAIDWTDQLSIVAGRYHLTGDKHLAKVIVHAGCDLDATDFTGQIDELVLYHSAKVMGIQPAAVGMVACEDDRYEWSRNVWTTSRQRASFVTNPGPVFKEVTKTA